MKLMKVLFLSVTMLTMGMAFSACGGDTTEDKAGAEYTSAYICPMHCEGSGSADPGKCPVCGMDYVANEDHKADHDGHDHNH